MLAGPVQIAKRPRTSIDYGFGGEMVDYSIGPSWDNLFGEDLIIPASNINGYEGINWNMSFGDMENLLCNVDGYDFENNLLMNNVILPESPSIGKRKRSVATLEILNNWNVDYQKSCPVPVLPWIPQAVITNTVPSTHTVIDSSAMFQLMVEPKEIQRKSYMNENRYLLPNPLVVQIKEEHAEYLQNTIPSVSVTLVNLEGVELTGLKKAELHGVLAQKMVGTRAQFMLKILDTAEGTKFRLRFTIDYELNGIKNQGIILSRPFMVYSNKRKTVKSHPIITAIKSTQGSFSRETEVWIKGTNFFKNMMVSFGDLPGKVLEVEDGLITVIAPARPDLNTTTTVSVKVFNRYPKSTISSQDDFTFVYGSSEKPDSL